VAERITGQEYSAFEQAYDWFNTELFSGRLPRMVKIFETIIVVDVTTPA
jgi:hypothetical protein